MGFTRQEAYQEYNQALKLGLKHQRECIANGIDPTPPVLDDILNESESAGQVELGVIDIPTERIIGTKTAGRTTAFSRNFLPVFSDGTEFASKWTNICMVHMSDSGSLEPIRCFEYLGKFYVQEGNKRVSVYKYFHAPTVAGYVIRIIPKYSDDPQIQRYYDFLHDYRFTGSYDIVFTQPGGFQKLQAALDYPADHVWTEEERRFFRSRYLTFKSTYEKLGGRDLPITVMDAMLVWLKVYPYRSLWDFGTAELNKSISAIMPDIKVLCQKDPIALTTEETSQNSPSIWGKLVSTVTPLRLNVAFINELSEENSTWTQAHMRGQQQLKDALGEQVTIQEYTGVGIGEDAVAAMEDAIHNGAQVIFTTTAPLIDACRKISVKYPHVKILNCSISMPYTGVRTYYSRIFEGKFISGAIAGAVSGSDEIGYIASYPIFGVPAGINAFALGAQLTNPNARICLRWSCTPGNPLQEFLDRGIDTVSSLDIPTPGWSRGDYGAFHIYKDGSTQLLASPYWDWGTFYIKLVRSILYGGWDTLNAGKTGVHAVNYWWGLNSGVIGLELSRELPEGVRSLAKILRTGICNGSIHPFYRHILDQAGMERNTGKQYFTPEEIINMDWLCENVDGKIPDFEELADKSKPLVRLLGIYRDQLPPVKEGPIL